MSGEGTSGAAAERNASEMEAPVPPELIHQAADMMNKTSAYLAGQLEGTKEEYKLIQQMNQATTQRYADMASVSSNVSKSLGDLNTKSEGIRPFLEQIGEIAQQTKHLEEAAYAIDAYSKALEQRFKALEKS